MNEKQLGKGGHDNPGRNKLPPEEKKIRVVVWMKPAYVEKIKEVADNLNRHGIPEPPKETP